MEKKKRNFKQELLRFIIKIGIFAAALCAMFVFVLGWMRMSENNMFPMVKSGDFVLYYRLDNPYINDAVVYEKEDGTIAIGRIAAIAGQEVDITDGGNYTVNGVIPSEYLPYTTEKVKDSEVQFPLTIPEGEYFILNDFRADTKDSRETGPVRKGQIKGKILFIFRRRSI